MFRKLRSIRRQGQPLESTMFWFPQTLTGIPLYAKNGKRFELPRRSNHVSLNATRHTLAKLWTTHSRSRRSRLA